MVYLAESAAGALLEACVHTSANDIPPHYTMLAVAGGDSISWEPVDADALPRNWIERVELTREMGTTWLRQQRSCLLRVPSALVPATWNVMLNPLHPDASHLRIESVVRYPFDPRIKK